MRRRLIPIIAIASMLMSTLSMAEERVEFNVSDGWDKVAIIDSSQVDSALNVRKSNSKKSDIVGVMYPGTAAEILSVGTKWTLIKSGDVTGYVRNSYLLYGEDARAEAMKHSTMRISANYDGVKLFASASGDSTILSELNSGDGYDVVADDGHWITVDSGDGETYHVSEEDVERVVYLEAAIPVAMPTGYVAPTFETREQQAADVADATVDEPVQETYVEPVQESYVEPVVDTVESEEWIEETQEYIPETQLTEAYVEEVTSESTATTDTGIDGIGYIEEDRYYDYYGHLVYEGVDTVSWYDEATGIVYGIDGIVLNGATNDSTTTIETEYQEVSNETGTVVEPEAAAETESYVETEAVEESNTAPAVSNDDLALMAAIIYCEAGHTYDGMVAVGAVVMNRVASSAFPNSISEVIYQAGQFTPASSGALASALASGVPDDYYAAAQDAMNGTDPTGGALYFNSGSGRGTIIGGNQFF